MKTIWKVLFIVFGLLIFLLGCSFGGGRMAMVISLFGALVMMVGLLPIIDKETFSTLKDTK